MQIQKTTLYVLVLFGGLLLIIAAIGGGLFNQQAPWYLQWQHQAFSGLCHQIPARSFTLNGQPMAVCTRCLGIYAGFSFGWMLLPVSSIVQHLKQWPLSKILLFVLFVNFIDIVGNMFGLWENTLFTRLGLGIGMGLAVALIFSGDFFIRKLKSMESYYGRTRPADG